MKKLLLAVAFLCITLQLTSAAPPAFIATSVPEGWTLVRGEADPGSVRSAKLNLPLELRTAESLELPLEATFRFRFDEGDAATFQALDEAKDAKPILNFVIRLTGPNQAVVTAQASGEPMATTVISNRGYTARKGTGTLNYSWRFPKVKNLWDDADRKEIGSAYAKLTPFAEKTFTLRLVLTTEGRQIWLDDRLVAEARLTTPSRAFLNMILANKAQVLSAEFGKPVQTPGFVPVAMGRYSHAKVAQAAKSDVELTSLERIPLLVPSTASPDINLGDSLFRYRRTHGSGPDTGYVNAMRTWPSTFEVDPATLAFRVPYRSYQNAWLLAWVDEAAPLAVPKGAFRFFRPVAGYPSQTEFEISEEAISKGLVTKLNRETAGGKQLYLVKVPIDTSALYGFKDMEDQFLEFELTKPLALGRSYPDPIYYGYHPAGPPSSIHVVGITLEEAPFDFKITPKHYGFVFEQPEKPAFTVSVTNSAGKPLPAMIRLETTSYDGSEHQVVNGRATVAPDSSQDTSLSCNLSKLGWHKLKATVEAGGVERTCTLSLVLLPPNTRTYGNAQNEVRFGTWNLLGHYVGFGANNPANADVLAMLRKLGLRKIAFHQAFFDEAMTKKYDFLPTGPHTVINVVYRWKQDDPEGQRKMIDIELAEAERLTKQMDKPTYFYGGEWHLGRAVQYAARPNYTGDPDNGLTEEEKANAEHHARIFTAIGKEIRQKYPQVRKLLQWGAPLGTIAYMQTGLTKDVVDGYGMDAPMFELIPEISNMTGCINNLWSLRQEAKRLGWPQLPIHWCEGPFFPTNPGALSETDQMTNQVRYLLLGMSYGIDGFEAGVVPHDAGNYYGAEHYGAGVFHRVPLENPKPAVAAIATMTSMLCGADPKGGVDNGNLTTYCMSFERAKDKAKIYALWRIRGTSSVKIKVKGDKAMLTDAMGNPTKLTIDGGAVTVELNSSPQWLTGVEITGFELGEPKYDAPTAKVSKPLVDMLAARWTYDGSEDKAYATNHFAVRRIIDPNLKAEFGQGEADHPDAVAITLPIEPSDRPMATRYGALKLNAPVSIPGKASALGVYIKGNSSWGRIAYQLRDAKGEIWTSTGTKDDWNCDDTHAWSYVNFEGWRYVRFPLPGTHPYDSARELETTWWGSRGGDGVVDLPLAVEKIFVEARNEVPYLGEMKQVPERSYKLSHLVAEYDAEPNALPAAIAKNRLRMPVAVWTGPPENLIAKLTAEGAGTAPPIRQFTEPTHFNDGRRMIIHFDEAADQKYNLYLSIYPDGRGADLVKAGVKNNDQVVGFKPETPMFLFLTAMGSDKKESKPSKPFELVTHDNFAEK